MRPPRLLRIGPRALILACSAALTIAVVGIAAGQTAGGSGANAQAAPPAAACAEVGKPVARPDAVPSELLPAGTVLTSRSRLTDGRTVVVGVIPRDFRSAVVFYVQRLPAAGYRNLAGDAEMDEAEAFFAGDGLRGKWKVNGILGCADAVTLELSVSG